MNVKVIVDKEEIGLSEFVEKMLGGTIMGAVGTLRGIPENWQELKIEIKK